MAKKKKDDEPEISKEMAARYRTRLTFLKNGKEFYRQDDFVNATKCYNSYIQILAEYKKVPEKKLSPMHFDEVEELPEMLLLSHTFWDLAKIYDRTPSLRAEFDRVLNQFVLFTKGYKYQHPNAGMLKRFIKKKKMVNKDAFKMAAEKLDVSQKKCYVATAAYGENHPITISLRNFRDDSLIKTFWGRTFVRSYYFVSPSLVYLLEKNQWSLNFFNKAIGKPLIKSFIRLFGLSIEHTQKTDI
jgi:hypothetical protein